MVKIGWAHCGQEAGKPEAWWHAGQQCFGDQARARSLERLQRTTPEASAGPWGISARGKACLSWRPLAQPLSTLWDSAHYGSGVPGA